MKQILYRYIFWTYERGSLHYDVMVTLILAFLFLSPRWINFSDRPVTSVPLHASEVLVRETTDSNGKGHFVYEIRADQLHDPHSDAGIRAGILNVVQPIAGDVTVAGYSAVTDSKGHVVAYDATIER